MAWFKYFDKPLILFAFLTITACFDNEKSDTPQTSDNAALKDSQQQGDEETNKEVSENGDLKHTISTSKMLAIASESPNLRNKGVTEVMTDLIKDPKQHQELIEKIINKPLPPEVTPIEINSMLRNAIYVDEKDNNNLAMHTFSGIKLPIQLLSSDVEDTPTVNQRPLMAGEIPIGDKDSLQVVKKIGDSSDYLVRIVSREAAKDEVINEFVVKNVRDTIDLRTKALQLNQFSVTQAVDKLTLTDISMLKEMLVESDSKDAAALAKSLDWMSDKSRFNLYQATVIRNEIQNLTNNGSFTTILDFENYIEKYNSFFSTMASDNQLLAYRLSMAATEKLPLQEADLKEMLTIKKSTARYQDIKGVNPFGADAVKLPPIDILSEIDLFASENHRVMVPKQDFEEVRTILNKQLSSDFRKISRQWSGTKESKSQLMEIWQSYLPILEELDKKAVINWDEFHHKYINLKQSMDTMVHSTDPLMTEQTREALRKIQAKLQNTEAYVNKMHAIHAPSLLEQQVLGEVLQKNRKFVWSQAGDGSALAVNKSLMRSVAIDAGVELIASAYGIYLLDQSFYARSYAERNNLAAQSTSLFIEGAASLLTSGILNAAGLASGFTGVAVPAMIFIGVGVGVQVALDKRMDKMTQVEKTHLFYHQLHHKLNHMLKNNSDVMNVNTYTRKNFLAAIKDSDLVITSIDLSGEQVELTRDSALHLKPEAVEEGDFKNYLSLSEIWSGFNNYSVVSLGETPPSQPIYTNGIHGIILPSQTYFSEPWDRKVVSTKRNGIYAHNYQLGAQLGLAVEKRVYSDFNASSWLNISESRHIYKLDHAERTHHITPVHVRLPNQKFTVIIPINKWSVDHISKLRYHLESQAGSTNHTRIASKFFEAEATKNKDLYLSLEGGSEEAFWDLRFRGFDPEKNKTDTISFIEGTNEAGQIEKTIQISGQEGRRLFLDITRVSGDFLIGGVNYESMSLSYVGIKNGEQSKLELDADSARNIFLKTDKHYRVMKITQDQAKAVASEQRFLNQFNTKALNFSFFLSNTTWEQGKAIFFFTDGTQQMIDLPKEDTVHVNLRQDPNLIEFIEFETTKSVKHEEEPTRKISQALIRDHLSEGRQSMCIELNQGQLSKDFRVVPNLCDANAPTNHINDVRLMSKDLPRDHKKMIYKIQHRNLEENRAVNYHPLSLDNTTSKTRFVTLRYKFQGYEYVLALQEELKETQKITELSQSLGSRADFMIPEGAEIQAFRVEHPNKSAFLDIAHNSEDFTPLEGKIIDAPMYIDINEPLFTVIRNASLTPVTKEQREERYLKDYKTYIDAERAQTYMQNHGFIH